MEPLSLCAIVQNYIKATRHRDDQLVKRFVPMTTPVSTTRNVVKVVHPLNFKWYVATAFDERKIAARVGDLRQQDHLAVAKAVFGGQGCLAMC